LKLILNKKSAVNNTAAIANRKNAEVISGTTVHFTKTGKSAMQQIPMTSESRG